MSKNDIDNDRKEYLEERNLLIESEREAARSFDKTMITLSAGALGLSITFIKQLAPNPDHINLIHIAWLAFIIALICILLSFLSGQYALRRQREIIDDMYKEDCTTRKYENFYACIVNWLNWSSLVSFLIGVVFFALFSSKNLS